MPNALVLGLIFPVLAPASGGHFAAFCVSLLASVILVAQINFIVGTCALKLTTILGLLRAKFWMQELLSGLLVPVALFPAPLRTLSGWLPFEHIGYTPVMIYLGKLDSGQVTRTLALETAWIIALYLFGRWFWNTMSRQLTVHGG